VAHGIEEDRYFASSREYAAELERLRVIEAIADPITTSRLERIGVAHGWSCLEVAAGAGSIAAWLGKRVGPAGTVLATDLNPRFLSHLGPPVEVEPMNLLTADLDRDRYDLVHGRAVLHHLFRDAEEVVAKMARATKPGGWLFIEEPDYASFGCIGNDPDEQAWTEQWQAAFRSIREAGSSDQFFGRRVRGLLDGVGFERTMGEGVTLLFTGTEVEARLMELTSAVFLAAGLFTEDLHARTVRLMNDPAFAGISLTLFGAWGRKPP
jgi:SAM-dependent methyltransferase